MKEPFKGQEKILWERESVIHTQARGRDFELSRRGANGRNVEIGQDEGCMAATKNVRPKPARAVP